MIISIKNMVCPRCVMAVSDILKNLNIKYVDVKLGEVLLENEIPFLVQTKLKSRLEVLGFELLDDNQQQIIEQIKSIVINYVHYNESVESKFSDVLTSQLYRDYSSLSKLFSSTEGMTIEHFVILQKTERIKELISYEQYTISEIALLMGYSSVAHLSAQFKKITNMTPSQFKRQKTLKRKSLDDF